MLVSLQGWSQVDTTYFSEFELANLEYGTISNSISGALLDRAISIPREDLKRMRTDSVGMKTASDWIMLFHAFNLAEKSHSSGDSTFVFNQKLFEYFNNKSTINDIFTLPIGILYKEGAMIKDEAYSNGQLGYSALNGGWELNMNSTINSIIEKHYYASVSQLFDEVFFDQEVRFVLDQNFIFSPNHDVLSIEVGYNGMSYTLYMNDFVDLYLDDEVPEFIYKVNFKDGTSFTQTLKIEMNNEYFDEPEDLSKGQLFTGGTHTFYQNGASVPLVSECTPTCYKLSYGIIWGDCNNSGKLRKPVFMMHGYRPNIQPIFPSLKKLYKKKFNFKGADYGDVGFVDLLVQNGYDVVICRIDPGNNSIIQGGELLQQFFDLIVDPQKESIYSKYENIVLGFSMGGHYWRHMLMKLEHDHLNNNANQHHHTRMWIPIDSPLHGANNPLAHQFAAKSLAENTAGVPTFMITYSNILSIGSQEQQRYDVNGINGFDGAEHRFHLNRLIYNNELENTFNLGSTLTKHKGFPSATRNVAVSVGSNSIDYYTGLSSGLPTYQEESAFYGLLSVKKWDVLLNAASYKQALGLQQPKEVYHRKIVRDFYLGGVNVLVDDKFSTYGWYELDNAYGSYINAIRNNVNFALRVNSLFGVTDYSYDGDQVFVPVLSALAIDPRVWPKNMRYNLKTNKLMFDELTDVITNPNDQNDHFGYPHLGRPTDYRQLTPMDAYYCNALTYEHITLIKDKNHNNDQSELISFLLNEIEPWYLDLQNQNLGQYARPNYTYKAKYEANNWIRTGNDLSPKAPFGDYNVLPNADLELQAGELIELKPGTHIQSGAKAHLYIEPLCQLAGKSLQTNGTDNNEETEERNLETLETNNENKILIYPNPNNGTFQVKVNFPDFEIGTLELFTLQGIKIGSWEVSQNTIIRLDEKLIPNSILIGKLFNTTNHIGETKILIR